MSFRDMQKDKVKLIKPTGVTTENISASVQGIKVFIMQASPLIESGDELVRIASNGLEERMRVIDPGFHESWGGIEAHYQITVEKLGRYSPEERRDAMLTSATYNFHGDNARVNHGSTDNSTNIINKHENSAELISELRRLINDLQLPNDERTLAVDAIDTIDAQFESGTPKASIVTKMLGFLPQVSTVVEIAEKLKALADMA